VKKILGLTIAAILVIGIVAAGTYAYFNDVEASTGNTITAGTLNLTEDTTGVGAGFQGTLTPVPGADGANDYLTLTNVAPGDSGTITFTLNNTGSLAGKLTLASTASFNENLPETEPEHVADATDTIGLSTNLKVWVTRTVGGTTTDILGASGVANYVNVAGLEAALDAQTSIDMAASDGAPGGNDEIVYVIHWDIASTVGNVIQGDSITLDINFTLDQAHA
jgi:spore coat-associated protein N